MKIELRKLKSIIREAASGVSEQFPKPYDLHVWVDEYTKRIIIDDIERGGDLSTIPKEDIYVQDDGQPQPGAPGSWLEDQAGMAWTFNPGELVRIPEYDQNGLAWASKSDLTKIKEAEQRDAPKTKQDKEMLKALSNFTISSIGMSDVPHFKIRLRKDSIYVIHDHPDNSGSEGLLTMADVPKSMKKGGLTAFAKWMFDNGAKKIKPQKRRSALPYYD